MASWLPPDVPIEVWDPKHLLHYENDDARFRARFVFGVEGETRAYDFDMYMGLLVVAN